MAAHTNAPMTINRVRIRCQPESADAVHQGGSFIKYTRERRAALWRRTDSE
jgi:hypothetical protein